MNFSQALEAIKEGKKVKRAHWGGYWKKEEFELYGTNEDGEMIVAFLTDKSIAPATPYQADLLAEDWEIVE